METLPFTVTSEAAVNKTEVPVPSSLLRLPTTVNAVTGKLFTAAPVELRSFLAGLLPQALIPALVALLVVVTLSPFADVILPRTPLQLGEVQVRFQLFGLLLAAAPQVVTVLVLTATTALLGGYRFGLRVSAVIAVATAVLYVVLVPLFALDFLTVRRQVNQGALHGFDMAAMKTGATAFLLALLLLWMAVLAFRAAVNEEAAGGKPRTKGQGLVVGQD